MVQMDNQVAIQLLRGSETYGGDCVHILHTRRNIIMINCWEVSLHHVYREGNRPIYWLPNVGVVQTTKMEMVQASLLELGRIIHEDSMGVAYV